MNKTSWREGLKRIYGILLLLGFMPLFSGAQLVNNGANIIINDDPTIVLNDLSFQNNGLLIPWFSTFSFTGSSPATIGGSSFPVFYQLNINKPGSVLQLQKSTTILGRLQFTEGLVDLNNNYISLYSDALLIGEKETSRIIGPSGGYVQISKTLNAPAAEDPGNLGAVISSSANLGIVTIRRGHQSQVNPAGGGNSIMRYYDIIPDNNNALNATLRLNYFDGELNGLNENNLSIWKRTGNGKWDNLSKTSGNTSTNYVELTGIADFTRFTLSTFGNTLPLVWSSFNTQCSGGSVRVSWKTEQELNTYQFLIRRSLDARTWTTIGTLPAAGNSNQPLTYSYTDQLSPTGATYYQIQQVDFDGRITLSPVLMNNCGVTGELKVYPNPVLNDCWVSLYVVRGGPITLQLFDNKGGLVLVRRESIQTGNNQIHLRMPILAHGIYSLIVTQPDGRTSLTKIEKY